MALDVPLSLNRIAKPDLPLPEFLRLAADVGMRYAEVRNDLSGVPVLDGLSEPELRRAMAATGVQIVTINALYPFEHGQHLEANLLKLRAIIDEARKVDCRYVVMCPFNEKGDIRTPARRTADLVAALDAYGPLFTEAGMVGLIEALGFERSALRTKRAALDGIERCAHPKAFALLHDTFHHWLSGEAEMFPAETAFVHVSGVARGKPRSAVDDDDDRILVDATDAMDNRGQLSALLAGGYKGIVSFEPFGPSVRAKPVPELKKALEESVRYLLA